MTVTEEKSLEFFQDLLKYKPAQIYALENILGPLNRKAGPSSDAIEDESHSLTRERVSREVANLRVRFAAVDHHHQDPRTTLPTQISDWDMSFPTLTVASARTLLQTLAPMTLVSDGGSEFECYGDFYFQGKTNTGCRLRWFAHKPDFNRVLVSAKERDRLLLNVRELLLSGATNSQVEQLFGAVHREASKLECRGPGWILELSTTENDQVEQLSFQFEIPVPAQALIDLYSLPKPLAVTFDVPMQNFGLVIGGQENARLLQIGRFQVQMPLKNVGEDLRGKFGARRVARIGPATFTDLVARYSK